MASIRLVGAAHRHRLERAAENAIGRALGGAALREQEPSLVARLVLWGIPEAARQWRTIFARSGIALTTTCVFCHQSPIVGFAGAPRDPELGDLLVVHFHQPRKGRGHRRALLLQAKKKRHAGGPVGAGERHQLHLYMHWPAFRYLRPASLRSERRSITPHAVHAGASYLLLLCGLSWRDALTAPPAQWLAANETFAQHLARMLRLRAGREFARQDRVAGTTNWSRVVWDLLHASQPATFRRGDLAPVRMPRHVMVPPGRSALAFVPALRPELEGVLPVHALAAAALEAERVEDEPPREEWYAEGEPIDGISLVVFETREMEE